MNAPESSPGSLSFALGPFPVVVRPGFWLVMALLGWVGSGNDPRSAISFAIVAFISVLFHELGHAVTGRLFGAGSWIELHSFGGLTHLDRSISRWRSVLMSAAGPGFGFVLGGVVLLISARYPPQNQLMATALGQAIWINFGWGIMNLLPILPLDGGWVLAGILGPTRRRAARWAGVIVSLAVVALALNIGSMWLVVMFGLMGLQNFQALGAERDVRPRKPPPKEKDALQRGWNALLTGDEQEAARLAHLALSGAETAREQNAARDLLAWVALADQNPRVAISHLERVTPPEDARRLTWALALESIGQPERALPHSLAAFQKEPSETSATLAVRLLTRAGRYDEAARVVEGFQWRSPAQRDARRADVAFARGEHAAAAALYGTAFEGGRRPSDAYNAACGHARAGDPVRAVEWLKRALDAGFDDYESLWSDPDLKEVRASPEIAARVPQPTVH
jgi:Zn-dependent protease